MQHKHTKGEWYAKDGQIYPIETGKTLATVPYYNEESEEMQANARLIAAAPDLLEALVSVLNWHKAHDAISFLEEEAIKKAEAAIQKALNPQP